MQAITEVDANGSTHLKGQPESKVDYILLNALLTGHSRASLSTVPIPLGASKHL